MKISFHGAAGGVTGSCHRVSVGGKTIVIDCGLFQGRHELDVDNAEDFGFDPAKVDFLLLTHAHLDHCGRIPLLDKRGFQGEVICTGATRDLTRLVLLDSAHLQEEESRHRHRRGRADPPLYDTLDVLSAFDRFGRTAHYGKPITLAKGITATFLDAGHILGSASILLELQEKDYRRRVLFSGDLGASNRPLLNDPVPPGAVDVVVMESTYGDRDHRSLDDSVVEFHQAIRAADAKGGNVIIPTFALERAQDLLYFLREGMGSGAIRDSMQVFLDSPMAISATDLFRRHLECLRPSLAKMMRQGRDPFSRPSFHFTREAAESMAINQIRGGAIIMAGSGMATGGRVRHHLRHNLSHSDNSVIFVGYAAEGTLARIIIDGARSVKLFGEDVAVRAKIHTINGFSAHAGRSDLLAWHAATGHPEVTYLIHGEERGREALARSLSGTRVEKPRMHQEFSL